MRLLPPASLACDPAPPNDDTMTLYGFGRIFAEGRGETKDLWAHRALGSTRSTIPAAGMSVDSIR